MQINGLYFLNLSINFHLFVIPLAKEFNSSRRNRGNGTQLPNLRIYKQLYIANEANFVSLALRPSGSPTQPTFQKPGVDKSLRLIIHVLRLSN